MCRIRFGENTIERLKMINDLGSTSIQSSFILLSTIKQNMCMLKACCVVHHGFVEIEFSLFFITPPPLSTLLSYTMSKQNVDEIIARDVNSIR